MDQVSGCSTDAISVAVAARRGYSHSLCCHGYLPALPSIVPGPHQPSGQHLPSLFIGDEFHSWDYDLVSTGRCPLATLLAEVFYLVASTS